MDYSEQTNQMLISVIIFNIVAEGNLNELKEVLYSVGDINAIKDYDFRTPLHIAAVNDRAEIAMLLINQGMKVNSLDRWRKSPLYEAV